MYFKYSRCKLPKVVKIKLLFMKIPIHCSFHSCPLLKTSLGEKNMERTKRVWGWRDGSVVKHWLLFHTEPHVSSQPSVTALSEDPHPLLASMGTARICI